jgi:hypothetical protein
VGKYMGFYFYFHPFSIGWSHWHRSWLGVQNCKSSIVHPFLEHPSTVFAMRAPSRSTLQFLKYIEQSLSGSLLVCYTSIDLIHCFRRMVTAYTRVHSDGSVCALLSHVLARRGCLSSNCSAHFIVSLTSTRAGRQVADRTGA